MCLTTDEYDKNNKCIFPFTYNNVIYNKCIYNGFLKPWCSTKTDNFGNHIVNKKYWGFCNKYCPVEENICEWWDWWCNFNILINEKSNNICNKLNNKNNYCDCDINIQNQCSGICSNVINNYEIRDSICLPSNIDDRSLINNIDNNNNMCLNKDTLKLFIKYNNMFKNMSYNFGQSCLFNNNQYKCISNILHDTANLNKGCSNCFSELFICMVNKCYIDCKNTDKTNCITCVKNKCIKYI